MQEFIFRDYDSDDEKRDNFKFEAKQRVEIFKCVFCEELPTDPRITSCCEEYVCYGCWKKQFVEVNCTCVFKRCICTKHVCCRSFYVNGIRDPYSLEDLRRFDQQKLATIIVTCPDIHCKKKVPYEARAKHWENDCDRLETCSGCAAITKVSDKHNCKNLLDEKIRAARIKLDSIKLKWDINDGLSDDGSIV